MRALLALPQAGIKMLPASRAPLLNAPARMMNSASESGLIEAKETHSIPRGAGIFDEVTRLQMKRPACRGYAEAPVWNSGKKTFNVC